MALGDLALRGADPAPQAQPALHARFQADVAAEADSEQSQSAERPLLGRACIRLPRKSSPRARRSRRSSRQSLEGLEGLDGYLRAGARRRDSLAPALGLSLHELAGPRRRSMPIFESASPEDIEHAYKNVYEARVARQIWKDFWGKGKRLQAIVLLATFDHYDLQRLLIERLDDASDIEIGWEDNEFKVDHALRPIMEASDECRSRAGSVEDVRLDCGSGRNNRSDASRSSTPRRQSLAEEQTSRRELYMVSSVEEHPRVAKSSLQSTASEPTPRGMLGLFHELTTESQCSATSSSSAGMQVVTRCLKDQVSWRDSA